MLPQVTQQPGINLDRLAARHAQAIIEATREVDESKVDGAVTNTPVAAAPRRLPAIDKSKVDGAVTKTLAILQESGFYACFLFLFAKKPKGDEARIHDAIVHELVGLLQGLGFAPPATFAEADVLPYVTETVTAALEPMLLAKETAEQMLTYARYGAKARA